MTTSAPSPKGIVLHRICATCDVEIREEVTSCPTCGSKLVEIRDEVDNLVGQIVDGRYEIRAKLGQGGMGTVYRAWQKSVGREVAVKLMDRSYSRDAMAVRRFLREARLASQLSQPNTVSVFDFGQIDDGRLFIAMELIRGKTLHEVVQATGAFSIERTVRIGVQICDALEAAHGVGIVHRDLKLENVIVLDHPPGRDLLKVLDFGLAKNVRDPGSRATESGIVVGTPRYMSPEAATAGVTGPPGDLYSLGVILGELAIGKPMWRGETLPELIAQKLDPKPVVARAPAVLRPLLERLLDPEPDRRPNAQQTRTLLAAIPTTAEPTAADTVADADPGATANIRSPSPPPDATRQMTPRSLTPDRSPLAMAPTATPQPITAIPPRAATDPGASASSAETTTSGPRASHVPAPSLTELERPPVKRWPLIVVGLGALAAIGVTIAIAMGGDDDKPTRRATTPPAPADAAVALAPPIDAAEVAATPDAAVTTTDSKQVTISIASEPPGATFMYRGKFHRTPHALLVDRGTKPIEIIAKQPGRASKKLTIVPDADKPFVVKLPAATKPGGDEVTPF